MRNRLLGFAVAALAADVLHDLDHVRRNNFSPIPVRALGFLGLGAAILVVVLAATRNRYAPWIAAAYGTLSATGFIAVHVLPHWGAFSDPLTRYRVDALSWASVALAIVADGALALVAVRNAGRATSRREVAPVG
jgi:hypothetical protein